MVEGENPEPTWWKEGTNAGKSSSDLHPHAVVDVHTPKQTQANKQTTTEDLRSNSLCYWAVESDRQVRPEEQPIISVCRDSRRRMKSLKAAWESQGDTARGGTLV